MNCKPGDLAIVLRGPKNRDRIVRCLQILPDGTEVLTKCGRPARSQDSAGPTWLLDGWILFNAEPYGWVELPFIADANLRPINDPGDDAVDEMVRLVPLPLPEIVPALLDREAA